MPPDASSAAERIARAFHTVYEDVAREEGWVTQARSRVAFDALPPENRRTMVKTVQFLLDEGVIRDAA